MGWLLSAPFFCRDLQKELLDWGHRGGEEKVILCRVTLKFIIIIIALQLEQVVFPVTALTLDQLLDMWGIFQLKFLLHNQSSVRVLNPSVRDVYFYTFFFLMNTHKYISQAKNILSIYYLFELHLAWAAMLLPSPSHETGAIIRVLLFLSQRKHFHLWTVSHTTCSQLF